MSGFHKTRPLDQTNAEWLAEYNGQVTEMKPRQTPANEDDGCLIESAPRVPAGEYRLAYVEHSTQKVKRSKGQANSRSTLQ